MNDSFDAGWTAASKGGRGELRIAVVEAAGGLGAHRRTARAGTGPPLELASCPMAASP